ncbi:ImmA/IrrE family metallo-endopeptidase [Vibrio sp. TRT 2004]|uniref:ImmA/IrrE family metallo-endopeptidase n=1 Tax=Vibrio sp. TRT 2004 TaxID=3418506 RepID=UPI003CF44F83
MRVPQTMPHLFKHYQLTWPADVEKFCSSLGIACIPEVMPDHESGYIELIDGYRFKIAYNVDHARVRQRFTIAHELGHYYLHRHLLGKGTGDNRAYRSDGTRLDNLDIGQLQETEANAFAADLLMPKELIKLWRDQGLGFYEIQNRLEVSESALSYRLQNLGIHLNSW